SAGCGLELGAWDFFVFGVLQGPGLTLLQTDAALTYRAPMQTIQLGKSSLTGSRLAYGCWRIAGSPEAAKVTAETQAAGRKAVIAAFEAGYTLFDLADIYCEGVC